MRNRSLVQAYHWFKNSNQMVFPTKNQPFHSTFRAEGIYLLLYKPSQKTEVFCAFSGGSGDPPPGANPWSLLEGWQEKAVQLQSTQLRPWPQVLRKPTKAGMGPGAFTCGGPAGQGSRRYQRSGRRVRKKRGPETTQKGWALPEEPGKSDSTPLRAQLPLGTRPHPRPRDVPQLPHAGKASHPETRYTEGRSPP